MQSYRLRLTGKQGTAASCGGERGFEGLSERGVYLTATEAVGEAGRSEAPERRRWARMAWQARGDNAQPAATASASVCLARAVAKQIYASSSSNAWASRRSAVSKPSVNHA